MRETARRWLIRGAWCGLLACACLWLGLRLGRPLYYTDGQGLRFGPDLAESAVLRWPTPEPLLQLPGPVRGRIAALPDGRLVYGRENAEGNVDLVRFDPARPTLPPEPLPLVNSPAHELAPAIGPDGTLWFSSDRPGGRGGYDLWRARPEASGFAAPEPSPRGNTAFDETDPAPSPDGLELVFVRVDRELRGGENGALLRFRLDDEQDPVPVLEGRGIAAATGTPLAASPNDRDPVFAPDGRSIWFLSQLPGTRAHLQRSVRRMSSYDAEAPVDSGWGIGGLRSPLLSPGGFELLVLHPGTEDLLYLSRADALQPWWPAQRRLEQLLLYGFLACLVLLVLLHLGRHFKKLDIVTLCLLFSLLLHLLVLLWLMPVELDPGTLPGNEEGEGLEVNLVDAAGSETLGGGAGAGGELAAESRFTPEQTPIAAEAPGAAMADVQVASARQAPTGEWQPAAVTAADAPAAALQDAAATQPLHAGQDQRAEVAPAGTAAVTPATARMDAARATQAAERVTVNVPQAGPAVAASRASAATPAAALPALSGDSGSNPQAASPATELRDRSGSAAVRSGADAGAVLVASAANARIAAPTAVPAPAPTRAVTSSSSEGSAPAATPGTGLGTAARERAVPEAGVPQAPFAQAAIPRAALQDHGSAAEPARTGPAPEDRAAPLLAAALLAATGPAAATTPATPRPAGNAAAAPREITVEAPSSGLLPGRSAARREAPAATAPQEASPRAAKGGLATATLRDQPPASGSASSTAQAALARTASGGLRPVTLPAFEQAAGTTGPKVNAASGNSPAAAPSELAVPGSQLAQPGRGGATRSPTGTLPSAAAASGRAGPAAVAAQDVAARTSAPATGQVAAGTGSGGLQRAALPQLGPAAPELHRGPVGTGTPSPAMAPAALPGSSLVAAAKDRKGASVAADVPGSATAYSNRFGPAKVKALEKFGGTEDTERAVAAGLAYLARIQNHDGSWGNREQWDEKYGRVHVGKSALCLLAFLGAGHTHRSGTLHSITVRNVIEHLLSLQDDDGAFGSSSAYGHGITTYALCECYGITKDERLLRPVERGLSWIIDHQGPRKDRKNRGGWGYFSPGLQPEDDYARVSVSSWMVMALESARLSGVDVPQATLTRASEYLAESWDAQNNWFRYNQKPSRLRSAWPTLPASTPAGAFSMMLVGVPASDERVQRAAEFTAERRPTDYKRYSDDEFVLNGSGNVYFWYYGTLCCFLTGGEVWERWNASLRKILPAAQSTDGSFAPIDVYARYAGDTDRDRSYTTAMCVLCLEIYYRYFTPLLVGR